MARHLKNRRPEEWRAVLEAFGWSYVANDGDDQVWKHSNSNTRLLTPSRSGTVVILTTASYMARVMEKSGTATKSQIKKWWKDNGYGE